ncbi:MAG: branched-chain amino acid ABC transporter permease [Reyranella sp.]|uniref:branched-chain amino acid ABC transporter permease n=1 Tax=Reyranella sp. TaxID=1929291 RepID=UPI001AD29A01|nr:branched-chain amino acid ABC transporter permease [Reyranella sp.]MBN9089316.1 branched-chain amino acid ABC transporter permease [Reyranella sp.]
MDASADLLINALISGLLLGGFYAAVSVGVAISFGMLDIVNIAHPAVILLGSYVAFIGNTVFGIDPILATVITLPVFYLLGMVAYQVYYVAFERRDDQSLRGLSFFFGILFIAEVGLILSFGVDYRSVQAWYVSGNLNLGIIELPWRLLVPFLLGMAMVVGLQLYLSRTFIGRAIQAVAQDQQALRLMAANPTKIKRIAFGLSFATAALGGAALIIIQPVEPSIGREYIGRVFAICVLGGLGSFPGMMIAAVTLGIVENLTATFFGPSWAPAVAFGVLLVTLAVRPSGILGR